MPRGKKKKVTFLIPNEPVTDVKPGHSDNEDLPEDEVDQMFEKKEKEVEKVTNEKLVAIDSKEWDRSDPVISDDLRSKVWIAVYACPEGHKTKATNRQKESGIYCFQCRVDGKEVMASIMPGLFDNPPARPIDDVKRVNARNR